MLTAYDEECIVLGSVLRWGRQAALQVMPQLTADKFIYGEQESLTTYHHRAIWEAMENVVLVQGAEPFQGNLMTMMPGESDRIYFEALQDRLHTYYRIPQMDPDTLRLHAERVDRNGIIYRFAAIGARLGEIANPEQFNKYVGTVKDVDAWATGVLREFQGVHQLGDDGGYVHIGEVVDQAQQVWSRQMAGEQMILLPCGIPALINAGLFPAGKFAVVHGRSTAGKSMVVHLSNLGTAIGMIKNGIKGCVAVNSLEMSGQEFVERSAAALAGFNAFTLLHEPDRIDQVSYGRFLEYSEFIKKLPLWIDYTPRIALSKMSLRVGGLHLSEAGPVRQLSTDYFELFDVKDRGKNKDSREQELADVANEHFTISRELGASVIGISQSTYQPGNRTLVAGLYGMRYSRALTHQADIVVELVNYEAAKRSGESYSVLPGLSEENVWLLLQKYKGGPTDVKIPLGWQPEYTRLYDPEICDPIGGNITLFDHLAEVEKLLKQHPTTKVIPIGDTPLGGFA